MTAAAQSAPRQFNPDAGLPGAGLPGDRAARLAARRAFVGLKLTYLDVLESIGGADAIWLHAQVRSAESPEDLWLLRAPVFSALAGPGLRPQRQALRRALDALFPDSQPASAFTAF
jgi:hypothetical protein